jgi:hypothetical protein
VTHLLGKELNPSILVNVVECLAKERIERFLRSFLMKGVCRKGKSSYIKNPHVFIVDLLGLIE